MTNFAKSTARLAFTATLLILAGTLVAEATDNNPNGGSGSSNCEDTARGDFNANVNSCNNVLSDLPGQLAQCISDAKADLDRALASCRGSAALSHGLGNVTVGGLGGFNGGTGGKGTKLNGLKANAGQLFTLGN